jgi:hypothetical protein
MHRIARVTGSRLVAALALCLAVLASCAPDEVPGARPGAPAPGQAATVERATPATVAPDDVASAPGPREDEAESTRAPEHPGDKPEQDADPPETERPGDAEVSPADGDERVVFPYGTYLFVEIVEERVMKSETGGQTTSLVGDQPSYEYDPSAGTLSGTLKGPLNEAALTIVGRRVISQIDRAKSEVGQLYSFTAKGQAFGLVAIDRVSSDGSVVILVDGELHTLAPGESFSIDGGGRQDDDRLGVAAGGRAVTVTNHGFLERSGLDLSQP